MKYLILLVLTITFNINANAQFIDCIDCEDSAKKAKYYALIYSLIHNTFSAKTSSIGCRKKTIRVNLHFFLNDQGGDNFTRTSDGMGNISGRNGVQFAQDIIGTLNLIYSSINPLRIPLNNSIPVNDKDVQFMIDGIYFVQDGRLNYFNDTFWNGNEYINAITTFTNNDYLDWGVDRDHSLNIFIQSKAYTNEGVDPPGTRFNSQSTLTYKESGGWGFATLSDLGYFVCNSYSRIKQSGSNQVDYLYSALPNEANLMAHEIGHCIGLLHTVMIGGTAASCPTIADDNDSTTICDDAISETVSARKCRDTLFYPYHPGNRASPIAIADGGKYWSNNQMDYSSVYHYALSPMQIDLIHATIEDNLMDKTVDNAVKIDNQICNFTLAQMTYYGKNVLLNSACGNNGILSIGITDIKKIQFSESVEIRGDFEVKNGGEFEIIKYNSCY